MEIIIEYAILDNLIIDLMLLKLTSATMKIYPSKKKVFLSALFGTICAVILPLFINVTYIIIILLKLVVGLLMILILSKVTSIKQFIATFLIFITYTFAFGGFIYAILASFNYSNNIILVLLYNFDLPISPFILVLYLYLILLKKLISSIHQASKINKFKYLVHLEINGKKNNFVGYLDSGNILNDNSLENNEENSMPINIISLKAFMEIFKNFPYQKLILNNVTEKDLKSSHYILAETINKKEKMLVFNVDKFEIEMENSKSKIFENVAVGVSKKNFKSFDILLNSKMI